MNCDGKEIASDFCLLNETNIFIPNNRQTIFSLEIINQKVRMAEIVILSCLWNVYLIEFEVCTCLCHAFMACQQFRFLCIHPTSWKNQQVCMNDQQIGTLEDPKHWLISIFQTGPVYSPKNVDYYHLTTFKISFIPFLNRHSTTATEFVFIIMRTSTV